MALLLLFCVQIVQCVCIEEHRAKNRTDQTTGPFITDPSDYIYEIQLL